MSSVLSNIFGSRYSIGELMAIDQGRMQKAHGCNPSLDKTWLSVKNETLSDKVREFFTGGSIKVFYVTLRINVLSNTGSSQKVLMQLDPDFNLSLWSSNRVRIFCSCADFKYRSAYLLGKRDSLFLNDNTKIHLGPAATNAPTGKTGTTMLCKHCYSALQYLMNNYQGIMRNL